MIHEHEMSRNSRHMFIAHAYGAVNRPLDNTSFSPVHNLVEVKGRTAGECKFAKCSVEPFLGDKCDKAL